MSIFATACLLIFTAQLILSGKFAKYDYGSANANMKVYNQVCKSVAIIHAQAGIN